MANITLYVGPEDEPIWARAKQRAKEVGTSVSALATTALAEHLERLAVQEPMDQRLRRLLLEAAEQLAPKRATPVATTKRKSGRGRKS